MGFAWILHDVNLRHWVQSFETEAIVDVDRLKDCCPEDIASIWDDVISHFLLFQSVARSNLLIISNEGSI